MKKPFRRNARSAPSRLQRGVSLIIVLIMTVIIGLTAAASMRNAVSNERVINNMRSETVAQQYAEAALRYCEVETAKATADRIPQLQDGQYTIHAVGASTNWKVSATWINTTNGRVDVPASQLKTSESSYEPGTLPQCFVEVVTLADTKTAWLITARGFSMDYSKDATSGRTLSGSAVWLQSYRTR